MADSANPCVWVILLRGINVNPTTRVAMADLRALLADLGYERVVTLLQSGNVLVTSATQPAAGPIELAIAESTGVRSKVVVLSIEEFAAIAGANPLLDVSDDHSKMVITFLASDIVPSSVQRPSDEDLAPERLVLTKRAIYQWCPNGILKSRLGASWWRQFGPVATTRNVRTVNRILAAAELG